MATIEPDAHWPGMWRGRFGGKLSDMANLSWTKDAAISIALSELNAGIKRTIEQLADERTQILAAIKEMT